MKVTSGDPERTSEELYHEFYVDDPELQKDGRLCGGDLSEEVVSEVKKAETETRKYFEKDFPLHHKNFDIVVEDETIVYSSPIN